MGYTAQVSGVIHAKFGGHGILGNPDHFLFLQKICVDVDLIDDTSCLRAAISIFNAQKTDPQRSSLSGGIVQTAETLFIPVL